MGVSVAAFFGAFLFASLLEYWVHRLMHIYPYVGKKLTQHYHHHRENYGIGVIKEFRNYLKLSPLVLPTLLISIPFGVGFISGAVFYAFFSAYAHQLQHDNPRRCFWMPMPVHYVHHKYNEWHHNFGLALDIWDRVFGTYHYHEAWDADIQSQPLTSPLAIIWW
ncbi:MAG: sterol desaturase family protein [Cyanobacteria bacterium P01_H01_bin.15]